MLLTIPWKYYSGYHMLIYLGPSSPRFGSSRGGPPAGKKFGNPGDRLRKKRWDLDELPKFEKNFYTEHPEVQRMSQVAAPSPCTHQTHMLQWRSAVCLPNLFVVSMTLRSTAGKRRSPFVVLAAQSLSLTSVRRSFPVSAQIHLSATLWNH